MRLLASLTCSLVIGALLAGCHFGFNLAYRQARPTVAVGSCQEPTTRAAEVSEDRGGIWAFVPLRLSGREGEPVDRLRLHRVDLSTPPFANSVEVQRLDPESPIGRSAIPTDSSVAVPEGRLFVVGVFDWYDGSEYTHPSQVRSALRGREMTLDLTYTQEGAVEPCTVTATLRRR